MNNTEKRKVLTELVGRLTLAERDFGGWVRVMEYADEGSYDYRMAVERIKQCDKYALWRDFDKTLQEFLP